METRRGCVIRFRLILAVVILFASVAPLAPVGTAAAAASTLTVTANTARSEFPKQLVFDLKAQSGSPITSVKIAYRVGDDPVTSLANVPVAAADHISTSYHIDLNQEYYPPGVTIHYQWRLTDQSNASLKTAWSNLLVVDPRFQWHEQTLGVVTGDVGAGKTVAVRAAVAALDPTRHQVIYIPNPAFGSRGLYVSVVRALGAQPRYLKAELMAQAADLLAAEGELQPR